ncbi:MAG: ferrous iron transporter B, partial [Clostridia bacterium]|nr:ferrous iron transporter B [Clostridia bacterium]
VKASTIILLCNTAIQIMQSFNWNFKLTDSADASILASIAGPFAYILVPIIGILSWEMAAAAITGFIAKENVVGTLAVCFGITNFININDLVLEGGASEVAATMGIGPVAALAYLMFNLFSPPCFAAIGAMSSEMKSAKWLWSGIALQLGVGFTVSFFVYQIGTLITKGTLGNGFLAGFIAIVIMVAVIVYLCFKANKKIRIKA